MNPCRTTLVLCLALAPSLSAVAAFAQDAPSAFGKYCLQCHGKAAMGGINLEQMLAKRDFGAHFQQWDRVTTALRQKRMPPAKMPQPSASDRDQAIAWVRSSLNEYARKTAGDPGPVTVRRLTSAEYAYTLQDLTGVEFKFDGEFATDAVGGEGFTNFGDVQFIADANLERYLEAAKLVANHAVIGAGPLGFFADPGMSGFELSAIDRIQHIYTTYGFRAAAGEGGKPYGLERYSKAFFAAWSFQHRGKLGHPDWTLAQLAAREGLTARFVEHIWSAVNRRDASYPTSGVVDRFHKLPVPAGADFDESAMREACAAIKDYSINWPRWLFAAGDLAEGGRGDERALVITDAALAAVSKHRFNFFLRGRRVNPDEAEKQPPPPAGPTVRKIYFSVLPANPRAADGKAVIAWRNPTVRMRGRDRGTSTSQPFRAVLTPESLAKLNPAEDGSFVTEGETNLALDVNLAAGAFGMQLQVEAELLGAPSGSVLRVTISDREEAASGTPVWSLMADPESDGYRQWKAGVLDFAGSFPQASHGEPAPSDKDEIPAPFDNTYNQPERDYYHTRVKYLREDGFLVEKMLDDATRVRLEHAWADLLASFEFHDAYFHFAAEKFKVDIKGADGKPRSIATFAKSEIDALPADLQPFAATLRESYDKVQAAQLAAHPGHIDDCLAFAARAWRRPLTEPEKDRLRGFYTDARERYQLDHAAAVRSLLARILVAPDFLYRIETPRTQTRRADAAPLSSWEIATRLSYFLWSSAPDAELRRAAEADKLTDSAEIARQAKRMLADPKARRFANEFFGQWLGFYRFDQHRGVDTGRFPEFTDKIKAAMYDEAVSFFEHIVRADRPVSEMLTADYTFANNGLAKHYGLASVPAGEQLQRIDGVQAQHRGGMMRLGAVLTATSAPLRTSPVKRGDWLLRRILGTPVPPPPPDAGSIPADPKQFGGLSVKQRLDAHRRNATCAGCHSRIDPLGFALEHYDPTGRWRDSYEDGKAIEDSGTLADQTEVAGVDGLLAYLEREQTQVRRNLSNKLLGFALGRTVRISDWPLVDEMIGAGADAPFSELITRIAVSPQFRNIRASGGAEPKTTTTGDNE
ncbi:MAG: DUF1592 domain-containing protein [Bryobacteraceae bacterium]